VDFYSGMEQTKRVDLYEGVYVVRIGHWLGVCDGSRVYVMANSSAVDSTTTTLYLRPFADMPTPPHRHANARAQHATVTIYQVAEYGRDKFVILSTHRLACLKHRVQMFPDCAILCIYKGQHFTIRPPFSKRIFLVKP